MRKVCESCRHSFYGHNGRCLEIDCGCQLYIEASKMSVKLNVAKQMKGIE